MRDSLPNLLPFAAIGLIALGLLLFAVSLRLFRRSRTDTFWRRRRQAGQRGWRVLVSAFVMLALGSVACLFTLGLTLLGGRADEPTTVALDGQRTLDASSTPDGMIGGAGPAGANTPPPDAASDPSATDASTPAPNGTPVIVVVTAPPGFTPTDTAFPTFTPQITPVVSDITPLPNAWIGITALDSQISDALAPLSPRTTFEAGAKRIYCFIRFQGMVSGVAWQRHLYRSGEWLDGGSYLWGLETEGVSYFFFGSETGFEPGAYEVRLFIGDSPAPVAVVPFNVVIPGG